MSANLYKDTAGVLTGSPPNNLPRGLPGFIGRESEILHIKRLLSQKRLVVLFGVNGVGKTHLAIRVAEELAGQFPDGVFFVSLDSIVLPEIFVENLAFMLGISLDPRSNSTEQFLAAISSTSLLLILDGFENVLQHAALLREIKARAPSVKILVTTNETLDLPNEAVLDLHGLAMPGRNDTDAENSPSVQLFLQHARVYSEFELDLGAIGHICRLLDGMPLAVELAAAWTSILACDQLGQRIEHTLALHPPDGISGELQSMLATFDAVWNLLAENEKRILMGLSIFKGSFSHQAASKITGASYFFIDELLNKRVIRHIHSQRYMLHPAFANFLQDKLQENPVLATDVEIRHGSFFLGLLRDSEYSLKHSANSPALEEIVADLANVRLAWKRTVAAGNLRLTQSALTAWITVLANHGWLHEAINALESLGARLYDDAV
ncbi:MAG: NACHT domain-containing protein, partial [Chloroflexota bacterium]